MKVGMVVLVQVGDKTQQLQELIKQYEGEISLLLTQKNKLTPGDYSYAICEVAALRLQKVITDLRGIL
jgi:hypothetical protein